eukprot:TRINITY_DN30830_c0_g1_i1.p1 TRINITY_DN30830_c0_g1~~TRINITY_DN30830_c0_g1_i1.p1  ORF type:complete len:335 (+),score=96.53 TRINITY_DN30830_c0_g1_i1:62-1066(+)
MSAGSEGSGAGGAIPRMSFEECVMRLATGATSAEEMPEPMLDDAGLTGTQACRRRIAKLRGQTPGRRRQQLARTSRERIPVRHSTIHGHPVTSPDVSKVLQDLAPSPLPPPSYGNIEKWCEDRYAAQYRIAERVLQDDRDQAVDDLTEVVDAHHDRHGGSLSQVMKRLHDCAPYVAPVRLQQELRRAANDPTHTITPIIRYYGVSQLWTERDGSAPTSPVPPIEAVAEAARSFDSSRHTAIDRARQASASPGRAFSGGPAVVARRPHGLGATPFLVQARNEESRSLEGRAIYFGSKRWHDMVHGAKSLPLPCESQRSRDQRQELWHAYSAEGPR